MHKAGWHCTSLLKPSDGVAGRWGSQQECGETVLNSVGHATSLVPSVIVGLVIIVSELFYSNDHMFHYESTAAFAAFCCILLHLFIYFIVTSFSV